MKTVLATLALALGAAAVPHAKCADAIDGHYFLSSSIFPSLTRSTDTTVPNFALTLEHLENAFYSGALAKFSAHDFSKAGLLSWARGRFEQVAAHEAAHVAFLSAALGANATQPCNYSL